jgi:hypothetical protein
MSKNKQPPARPLPGANAPGMGKGKYTSPWKLSTGYPQAPHSLSTGNATTHPEQGNDNPPLYQLPYDDDGIQISPIQGPPLVPVLPPSDITTHEQEE